jgi:hypothetical protein
LRRNILKKSVIGVVSSLIIAAMLSFSLINGVAVASISNKSLDNISITPSLTLLAAGAQWTAQRGNSALFVDWEDNYLAHGNTDGVNWGPWPSEVQMKNWTDSVTYVLNQSGLNVHLAGDIPDNLTGYDLLVIHAYWAVEPNRLAVVRDFIANGGGVVLLSGVPEYFRCYCKDWWTYRCPTDNASIGMDGIFGCDGNYFNTGGYANVTVDNPFGTGLMTGDTLIQGAGYSNAAVFDPYNGSQVIATWQAGPDVAFAYTYPYGQGRVYYQAAFVSLDPPSQTVSALGGVVGINGYKLMFYEDMYNSLYAQTIINYSWSFNADKLDGTQWITSGISSSSTLVTDYSIPAHTTMHLPYYVYLLSSSAVKWGDWLKVSYTFHWTCNSTNYSTSYVAKLNVHPGDTAGGATVAFPYLGADGKVSTAGLTLLASNWGKSVAWTGTFNPTDGLHRADTAMCGKVGIADLTILARYWGKTWSNTPPLG